MIKSDVKPLLESMGAITRGHFEYRSKLHGEVYVNKDMLYTDPHATMRVCSLIADEIYGRREELRLSPTEEFAIVSPAVGGVALSQWTAYHLQDLGMNVIALYADKNPDGGFVLKRGYEKLVPGKKVVVVEDILTTGSSARDTVTAVKAAGGEVVMAVAICNRTPSRVNAEKLGVPYLSALFEMELPNYEPLKCPLCAKNIPISNSLGHGAKKV
jgi:orotate phosphoribosyltransferase